MKRSSVALIGCCALIVLPMAAFASYHGPSGGNARVAGGRTCPRTSTIGIKYGTYPYSNTFSSLTRSEHIGVNCATDRQCLLLQLRNQGLALKEKDGGTLTPEHRLELQAQLDSINARFH